MVEPQAAFLLLRFGGMAGIAMLGEDGADSRFEELDLGRAGRLRAHSGRKQQATQKCQNARHESVWAGEKPCYQNEGWV
jgi:hypothetical protein